jgi:hypothetical protein
MPGDILLTVSGVELACSGKQPRIAITAYSGAAMRVPGWGVIVLDLAGLDLAGRVPILCDHDASLDGILGQGAAEVKDGKLFVSGAILPASDKARRVVELAQGGFLFEASVGVEPSEHVRIKAGERIEANNRTLTAPEGGFTLIRKGKLREVSVVSLGADNRTSVAIAAMKGVDMNEEDIRAQERERLAKITALCDGDWGKDKDRVDALKVRAIAGEIEAEDLSAKLLGIMRSARPAIGSVRPAITAPQPLAIEAALLMRLGHGELAEKTLGERACDAGERLSGAHLLDLCRACLEDEGMAVPSGRLELVRASMSTYSLPTALGGVANKLLLDAYNDSPGTWRAFCAIRSVADFKENTAIRPSFTGNLEPVAPGGELKHGSVGEHVTTFKADTYGKLLSIDRRDIVNDDLGLFEDSARAMGKAAMRKLADLVYTTLLGNEGPFFSSANGNLVDGTDSALSMHSLSMAIQAMRTQRDEESNDLDLVPVTLLVPPQLAEQAKSLLESEFIQRMAEQPTGNSLRRAVGLEVEPRLSNTGKFGDKASPDHWFLFAAPSAAPLVVAFLNGKQEPTTEFFGIDQTVDKLAVSWRVFHDFGVAFCDPRAAVRVVGE